MSQMQNVLLLNDSFPPEIDGVANAVVNYGLHLPKFGCCPTVLTPDFPGAVDDYPFEVVRYPSVDLRNKTGYMAGLPFTPEGIGKLDGKPVSLIHTHCPVVSTLLSRQLRQIKNAPIVLTYHTKFDIDIKNLMHSNALQKGSIHALVNNISACDEIWAVSRGAAENLRSLGFEGDIRVMPNGVDLPREQVSPEVIAAATAGYDLPDGVPIFLFVGRMMWYKGLKIILDALAMLHADGVDFRMVFIGNGGDFEAVKAYSESCGLGGKVIFTGAIRSRDALRGWYCKASLFLFPSTFDTNGLVVREAAACSLGAMLIAGSCAAEGVTHGRNCVLIEENSRSMYEALQSLCANPAAMAEIGENAARELYISWEDAVGQAAQAYGEVIDKFASGLCHPAHKPTEEFLRLGGEMMEDLSRLQQATRQLNDTLTKRLSDHFPELSQWL